MRLQRHHRHFWASVLLVVIVTIVSATQSGWLQSGAKVAEKNQPGLYTIHQFIDGDTISVNMNGYVETIRLIGVDTPETHRPNTPVQCYGEIAAAYTKQLIGRASVRLQADSLDTNRDRYGRLLRYVYLPDGTLVENKLIEGGYGFAYTLFPFEKTAEFKALEQQAKAAHRGLWATCQVTVQADGREQTNPAN